MINKSRVFINTNFNTYFEIFKSLFFKKNIGQFVKELKKYLRVENLILTSQGRVAIYILIKSLISKQKNTFITSPYTLTEALNAVIYAGGKLVFVDIDQETGLPKIDEVAKKINYNTAGIIITHLISNERAINKFINKFKEINIIEDTAINFGAHTSKGKLGTLSGFGIYSFGTMKNLCLINGGMLYVKNKNIFKKCQKIRRQLITYPKLKFLKKVFLASIIDFVYNKNIYNYISHYFLKIINNYNIFFFKKLIYPGLYPNFQKELPIVYKYNFYNGVANLGVNLLKKIDLQHSKRIKLVKIYESKLESVKSISFFKFSDYNINSFLEYPIRLKNIYQKKKILKYLFESGFDLREKWYVNNTKFNFDTKSRANINSQIYEDTILCLPTNQNFNEYDVDKLCDCIINYFKKYN